MDTYKVLTKIYETWGEINRISPLPSADDLRFDALHGRTSISNKQIKWLEKFQRVWAVAEDHEHKMSQTEEDKCSGTREDFKNFLLKSLGSQLMTTLLISNLNYYVKF